jgi:hypothetical protein
MRQGRSALGIVFGFLLGATAGAGAGYYAGNYLLDRPVNWYAADISKLGPGPENDLIRYGRDLIVNTPRHIGKNATDPAMRMPATISPARTVISTRDCNPSPHLSSPPLQPSR